MRKLYSILIGSHSHTKRTKRTKPRSLYQMTLWKHYAAANHGRANPVWLKGKKQVHFPLLLLTFFCLAKRNVNLFLNNPPFRSLAGPTSSRRLGTSGVGLGTSPLTTNWLPSLLHHRSGSKVPHRKLQTREHAACCLFIFELIGRRWGTGSICNHPIAWKEHGTANVHVFLFLATALSFPVTNS